MPLRGILSPALPPLLQGATLLRMDVSYFSYRDNPYSPLRGPPSPMEKALRFPPVTHYSDMVIMFHVKHLDLVVSPVLAYHTASELVRYCFEISPLLSNIELNYTA